MITQLLWITWTSLSAVRERLLNLITHSLTHLMIGIIYILYIDWHLIHQDFNEVCLRVDIHHSEFCLIRSVHNAHEILTYCGLLLPYSVELGQYWLREWDDISCWNPSLWKARTCLSHILNTLRPRQNGRRFADDIFKCIFLNENVWIPIIISLKFIPKGPINNIPALFQIMAWRRLGDKPLSKPMMTKFIDAYMRHSASMS